MVSRVTIGKFKRQSCYGWVHLSSSGFSLHFFPTTSAQNTRNKTRGCRNIISAQRTACRDLRLPLPLLGTVMWPPLMGTAVPVGGTSSRSRVQSWDPQGPPGSAARPWVPPTPGGLSCLCTYSRLLASKPSAQLHEMPGRHRSHLITQL